MYTRKVKLIITGTGMLSITVIHTAIIITYVTHIHYNIGLIITFPLCLMRIYYYRVFFGANAKRFSNEMDVGRPILCSN